MNDRYLIAVKLISTSVLGHKRKSRTTVLMSVKPPKAEVAHGNIHKMQRSVSGRTVFAAATFRHQRPFHDVWYPIDELGTPTNIEIVAILFARAGEEKRDHTHRVFAGEGYLRSTPQEHYGTPDVTDEQVEKHTRGNGLIAYMPKGKGAVATGPTVDWCYALGRDEFIDKITRNVLDRFTA